ncbi:DUF4333 domain-containing protein [Actinomadura verrucosospora]|uniref:DUF4333 domain-containing protein n=1 Tax=Actinomadura verrucosospora TaxID=46165 RepID=A0A7D4A5B8_ACTVE|nr:DUF4333 domain-containing protein [Actinomadura verrucosospora]QKG21127.1 hypothetical protein ACTIVE_2765 [Actinomadura verrucosospora]
MKFPYSYALVLAACALAAGCGGGSSSSGKEKPAAPGPPSGHPISAPAPSVTASPRIQPSPSDDAGLIEQLKYDLRLKTIKMAGTPGRTSAACDRAELPATKGATTTCTVTYEGIKVTWPVTITGPAMGGLTLAYEAEPSTGILTAKGAEADFWGNNHDSGTELHCDDMPAVKQVPLGQQTGYHCSYLSKSLGGEPLRVPLGLIVREDGPYFRA